MRAFAALGYSALAEVTLPNGRRADVLAIDGRGQILLVEVKSSVADFRADAKWPEYRAFCDFFYFAVPADFPQALIPETAGLLVADGYGAEMLRDCAGIALPAARRKALLLRFAHLAASRLQLALDPQALEGPL